jgi:hypothetical protein
MKALFALLLSCSVCVAQGQTFGQSAAFKQVARPNTASIVDVSSLYTNLVAYWTFETALSLTDSTGNGYTLSNVGGIANTNGCTGNAVYFTNNVSQRLTRADSDNWSAIGGNSITLAGWVYQKSIGTWHLITKFNGSTSGTEWAVNAASSTTDGALVFMVYTNSTSTAAVINDGKSSGSGANFVINKWYFICAEIDATNLVAKLRYGTETNLSDWKTSATFGGFGPAGMGTNTTTQLYLGMSANFDNAFDGRLDEWGVWRRRLTDLEVTNLWNNGIGRTYPF